MYVAQINTVSVSVTDLSCSDPVLSKIYQCLQICWPIHIDNALKPYWNRHTKLSILKKGAFYGVLEWSFLRSYSHQYLRCYMKVM